MAKKEFLNRMKNLVTTDENSTKKQSTSQPTKNKEQPKAVHVKPLAEYEETLYARDGSTPQRPPITSHTMSSPLYRNVDRIEDNIDTLSERKKPQSQPSIDDEIGKKVDDALSRKPYITHRKPSNVIYVVSKPQPGQVRGDWAVRSHGKIFSHHRTKEVAIRAARQIARERGATVLIQRMDGTFSEGFKPRKK